MQILYSLFKLKDDKYGSPYFFQTKNADGIKNKLQEFDKDYAKKEFIDVFPSELKGIASRAVGPVAASRPDLRELKTNPFFNDDMVKGIYYIDNFYSLQESNKPLFISGLTKLLPRYSAEIIEKRVYPFISNNISYPNLAHPLTLMALYILEKKFLKPMEKCKDLLWPIFLGLIKTKKISGKILFLLVSHIDTICELLTDTEVAEHIINLLFKCFDCKVPQIQLICIQKTYCLIQKVSFSEMKSRIMPRMLMLCSDPDHRVKKAGLKFIKERMDLLDPSLVQSQGFTIIESNLKENNPSSINFLLLELLEDISKDYDVDLLASKVLPILIKFLVNKSSSQTEFDRYYQSVNKYVNKIKEKRMSDLMSQPNANKPEEPDESNIQVQSIEAMVGTLKNESFDVLFSKQNQMGISDLGNTASFSNTNNFGGASQTPSSTTTDFDFSAPVANTSTPGGAWGDMNMGMSSPVDNFAATIKNPPNKPTVKFQKPQPKEKAFDLGLGDLTSMNTMNVNQQSGNMGMTFGTTPTSQTPSSAFPSANKSAFDALDNIDMGMSSGTSGGNMGGFGTMDLGSSQPGLGNTLNSLDFGNTMTSNQLQGNSQMPGLMMNNMGDDDFADLTGATPSQNPSGKLCLRLGMTFGNNPMGGSNNLGGMNGMGTTFGGSLGTTPGSTPESTMGGFGASNNFDLGAGNSFQTTLKPKKPIGIQPNSNQQTAKKFNDLNEFDLL